MLAGDDERPRLVVAAGGAGVAEFLMRALVELQRDSLIVLAKADDPPEPSIDLVIERFASPICAADFEFSEPRPSRSKSKHERRKARGWR